MRSRGRAVEFKVWRKLKAEELGRASAGAPGDLCDPRIVTSLTLMAVPGWLVWVSRLLYLPVMPFLAIFPSFHPLLLTPLPPPAHLLHMVCTSG